MKRYRSLTTKLLLGYILLLSFVLGTTSFISENLISARFVANLDENLLRQAYLIADMYPANIDTIAKDLKLRITIINLSGEILLETDKRPEEMEVHLDRPEVKEALEKGYGFSSRYSHTLNTNQRYVAIKENNLIYRIAIPLTMVNSSLKKLRFISFSAAFTSIIFGSFFAYFWNKKILRPLSQIADVAEDIAGGNLAARMKAQGSDEIFALASSFNLMADRLSSTISDLTSEKNKLNAVITSMADGLITIDSSRRISVINPQACLLLGFNEPPLGQFLEDAIEIPLVIDAFKTALDRGVLVSKHFSLWSYGEKQMEIKSIPLKDETNHIIGAVGVINDLTEIKRLEKVRKDFVSNVSHELRTPLTSVNGFIETMRENYLDRETSLHFLEIMHKETQRMINLINDLLTISRLESGYITLKKNTFEVSTLWRELEMLFQTKASLKGIDLLFQGKAEIFGDRDQIKQIYINLIDNAIKYSDKGSVIIKAEREENKIVLSVSDQGSGVPKEDQNRLFERFYRIDKARSRLIGGTGLGLSIVKHIAEEHGGKTFVQSELGQGSIFGVELPVIYKK